MAFPLIPFIAGAVVGGLATYLYQSRQVVRRGEPEVIVDATSAALAASAKAEEAPVVAVSDSPKPKARKPRAKKPPAQ